MDSETALTHTLADAGCKKELTDKCAELFKQGRKAELMRLLSAHRSELLEALHGEQDKLDCLDYYLFKLRQGDKK